jgi:excisionase family DNA binding protein
MLDTFVSRVGSQSERSRAASVLPRRRYSDGRRESAFPAVLRHCGTASFWNRCDLAQMATAREGRPDGRLLLDLPEVATSLSLSLRSVQALVYSGQLRSVTLGRSRRVVKADLEAFVEDLRGSP